MWHIGTHLLIIITIFSCIKSKYSWDNPNKRYNIISKSISDNKAIEQVLSTFTKKIVENVCFQDSVIYKDEFSKAKWLVHLPQKSSTYNDNEIVIHEKYFGSREGMTDSLSMLKQGTSDCHFEISFVQAANTLSKNNDEFTAKGVYRLNGRNTNGSRVSNVGNVKVIFSKSRSEWPLKQIVFTPKASIKSKGKNFESLNTPSLKKINTLFSLRREAIRRGGYAIANGDINNDGYVDFFVGDQNQSFVLMNEMGKDLTIKNSILSHEKKVKAAAFIDFDNDGNLDIVGTKFMPESEENQLFMYRGNESREFTKLNSFLSRVKNINYPMPLAVGSFNNDRYPDLYIGYPGSQDFTFFKEEMTVSDLQQQGVYENLGKMNFRDVSSEITKVDTKRRDVIYPHSSIAFDIDNDFDSDLIVLDDRDKLSPLYRSNGQMGFEKINHELGFTNYNYAMGAAIGDLNNDGHFDMVVTYVNLHSASLFESIASNIWSEKVSTGFAGRGVEVYLNNTRGSFYKLPQSDLIGFLGEGMANVELIDFDNDGLLDIYVSNGLWSGGKKSVSSEFVFQTVGAGGYGGAWPLKDRSPSSSQSHWMTKLIGDVETSFAGTQRNTLLKNLGNGQFVDVAFATGVDSLSDGYVVNVADFDNNGSLDLILRNGDAGNKMDGYKTLEIFLNKSNKKSIRVSLEGRTISKDAIGAKVTLDQNGNKQYRQVIANNGASQSERTIHFGIGEKKSASKLEIEWSKGKKQIFKNVKAGSYKLVEGEKLVPII